MKHIWGIIMQNYLKKSILTSLNIQKLTIERKITHLSFCLSSYHKKSILILQKTSSELAATVLRSYDISRVSNSLLLIYKTCVETSDCTDLNCLFRYGTQVLHNSLPINCLGDVDFHTCTVFWLKAHVVRMFLMRPRHAATRSVRVVPRQSRRKVKPMFIHQLLTSVAYLPNGVK